MTPILGLFTLTPIEILIIVGLGLLLFGRKLPDMGRFLGKGIVEFKKGIKGLEDDIDGSATTAPRSESLPMQMPAAPPQRVTASVPKFEDGNGSITTPPKP